MSRSLEDNGCGDEGGSVLESGQRGMPNRISLGDALSEGMMWSLIELICQGHD